MNGAKADPCVSTISPLNKSNTNMIGASQNFFLSFIKPKNSFINSIINMPSIDFYNVRSF